MIFFYHGDFYWLEPFNDTTDGGGTTIEKSLSVWVLQTKNSKFRVYFGYDNISKRNFHEFFYSPGETINVLRTKMIDKMLKIT